MRSNYLSLLALFILTPLPQCIKACSCSWLNVKEAFESTDAILIGKVLNISQAYHEYYMPDYTIDEKGNYAETGDSVLERSAWSVVEIHVSKKIKNSYILERITILTPFYDAACGYTFRIGEEYIIYANVKRPQFHVFNSDSNLPFGNLPGRFFTTSYCTRTTSFIERELKAIEAYRKLQDNSQ